MTRIRAVLPADRMVSGAVSEDGHATVGTARTPTASGAEGRGDAGWVEAPVGSAIGRLHVRAVAG